MFKYVVFFLFLVIGTTSVSQSSFFVINDIIITGHIKTKKYVVHKELDINIGDTIDIKSINNRLHKNENRLYDTKLFNIVKVTYQLIDDTKINISIHLENSWFVFPAPIFELASENFTTWWKRYHFSLKWINYGMRLDHINLTGHQDKFKLVFQTGFTKKYEVGYFKPHIYESKFGTLFNAYYTTNSSVGYKTENNRVVYWHTIDTTVLRRFRLSFRLSHRSSVLLFQELNIQYHNNKVHDYLAKELNTDYFLNANSNLQFFMLQYNISFDKRIFKLYPKAGYVAFASVKKEGIGLFNDINLLRIKLGFEHYFQSSNNYIFQFAIEAKTELNRNKTPYSNYAALGYGDSFVRGYESYVTDGIDYLLSRNSIRKSVFRTAKNLNKWMPLKAYKKMTAEFFVRFNFELAFVNDPFYKKTNTLNNNLMIGYGPAIDLILYNNYLFSLEYNFNNKKEHSIYLHNLITLKR